MASSDRAKSPQSEDKSEALNGLQQTIVEAILKLDQIRKPERSFITSPKHISDHVTPESKKLNLVEGESVMFVIPPALERYGLDLTQDKKMPSHFQVSFKNVDTKVNLYVLPNGVISAPVSEVSTFHYFYDESKHFKKLIDELGELASEASDRATVAHKAGGTRRGLLG